ncbi:acyltransferase family protein [Gracilibacillus oryzae]|uniref:Acyltransferase family protein n=1 Tax=Gracilibacillus oryzae TaxID=1672701 RepID=A0A7C8KN21_9BACI|nr:acyltransferase family protein [Gracilibacillus oryzae]KAB8127140.1 acyltransferase family protein [Gracilibacillus oryzae]
MQREAYFDNAKLLFIFLVVFGHLIQPLKHDIAVVDALYQTIYLVHMPVFILISGFFAKGASDKGYLVKLMKRILLPYFLFHIFYSVYFYVIGKSNWDSTIYDPHWGLWFLLSLFSWHLLLIVYKKIPPFIGITLAFAIGILAGYIPYIGEAFSLSRTFVFFPFFLIGYWLTKERIFRWKTRLTQSVSAIFLAAVFLVSYVTPKIPAHWLFGSVSYQGLDMPVYGGLARIALYGAAIMMVFALLMIVPRKTYSFTTLGKQTMYVYLLHGVIIQYARQANLLQLDHNLDTIGLAVISVAIVWSLSSKWVMTFTQPIVEGKTELFNGWTEGRNKSYRYEEKSS